MTKQELELALEMAVREYVEAVKPDRVYYPEVLPALKQIFIRKARQEIKRRIK